MSGLKHTTILIVEDQMQIRGLLASVLRTFGVGNILRGVQRGGGDRPSAHRFA